MRSLRTLSCSFLTNFYCCDSTIFLRFIASILAVHCTFLLDGKVCLHPQTARLTCNVVSHCGHTFLRSLLLSMNEERSRETLLTWLETGIYLTTSCCPLPVQLKTHVAARRYTHAQKPRGCPSMYTCPKTTWSHVGLSSWVCNTRTCAYTRNTHVVQKRSYQLLENSEHAG